MSPTMTKEEMVTFGQYVRAERRRLDMTQKEFAQACGVSFGTIQTVEIGKARTIGARVKGQIENYLKRPNSVSEEHAPYIARRPAASPPESYELEEASKRLVDRICKLKGSPLQEKAIAELISYCPTSAIVAVYEKIIEDLIREKSR